MITNYLEFNEAKKYLAGLLNVDFNNPIDLLKEYPEFFYKNINDKDKKEFKELVLSPNSDRYRMIRPIKFYHGTSSDIDIMNDGLLRTTLKNKKSYQSTTGFVYLAVFPDQARTFGEIAYAKSGDLITVYEIYVPVYALVPDKDQLLNNNCYDYNVVNSILIAHTVCVKYDIPPYYIKKTNL
jgi:hypothetical protein